MRGRVYAIFMDTFLTKIPIAHRGLHGDGTPENSLAAFRTAAEAGYAIETDVRFSKDREVVVFHDGSLRRMTGDERDVCDCTLKELRELRLAGTDERIPTLKEFLAAADGAPLLIEIKSMPNVAGEEIGAALLSGMKGYRGEYAVQSFQPFYARAYKKLCPEVPCGVLACADYNPKELGKFAKFKAFLLRDLRLNFVVKPDFVSYSVWDLPRKSVQKFKGIRLGWTVRSPLEEERARKYVDNVIFENYRAEKME